ncbi:MULTISPECIES: hypothetical protein [Pseudomonas]|uniref:hypothetical protein n=1 Tax=Pseudomonas TaxID=286 RepID=UPI0018689678|nr:hypothetical protein [Pseudomonas lundensis]
MINQLKLLLDAARWRDLLEDDTIDPKANHASKCYIDSLVQAINWLEQHNELTKDRPADYDPHKADIPFG